MEIERKFLIRKLPVMLKEYAREEIEQGYLCVNPVVRVRRQGEEYYLTYKGGGLFAREEYNLPLTKEGYDHLLGKADGYVITKTRYLIPVEDLACWEEKHDAKKLSHEDVGDGRVIELDVFHGAFEGLILAEIEFSDREQAKNFVMPPCFLEDVTFDGRYHNSYMSRNGWDRR